jgi:ABC-type Fe3+-hydroxamate transport system substrate-binding protein/adenosylcobinamide amidohydrolase
MMSCLHTIRRIVIALVLALAVLSVGIAAAGYPVEFTDSCGSSVAITGRPRRVVSLVPGITEIIQALGAGDALHGVTVHDAMPPGNGHIRIVGGFSAPAPARIRAIQPDVVFLSSLHGEVRQELSGEACQLVELQVDSMSHFYETVELLGRVFESERRAAEIVSEIREQLELVSNKLKFIPTDRRKRAVRIMGVEPLTTPGDDSFQNEFIRAAGGIPPELGKQGAVVEMTVEEWQRFNPQVIYICGGNRRLLEDVLSRPGWKDVEAVRTGSIHDFPCDLTCRASVRSGQFISYLASILYEEPFSDLSRLVLDPKCTAKRTIDIPLNYVRAARVEEHPVFDFTNKTLVVELKEPMRVLSTLEGERRGVLSVGNHYSPPPCWGIGHRLGLEASRRCIHRAIGKTMKDSCFLFTGADMDHLSVRKAEFGDLAVHALVTAGVVSNAVRMSRDEGRYIEPGTINMVLMANRRLTPRAMARLVISATEAKTAALQDLDVRSSQEPARWQATGTGTDEIIVVEGRGRRIDNTGGHCKIGELAARAVHEAVTEAVRLQNGLTRERSIFQRLRERRIDLHGLLIQCSCLRMPEDQKLKTHLAQLEDLLLEPRHAAFLEAALALSDAFERGLISDLEPFNRWCRQIAEEIGGRKPDRWSELFADESIPVPLRMALNALTNGAALKHGWEGL